jgi:carboxyl-terminal processing protease
MKLILKLRRVVAWACVGLALGVTLAWAAEEKAVTPLVLPPADKPISHTDLQPAPADWRIAYTTARLLAGQHYSKHPFDDEISSKFLDMYLRSLDPQRLFFLQSDIDEFEVYRKKLDDLTLSSYDVSPAYEIFNRYYKRLEQRVAYTEELLKTDKFCFDTDERVTVNRRDLPWPKNLSEAKQLWRERLRYEYLQEKLNKEKPEEIVKILSRRYHRNLRFFADWTGSDVMQIYLTALAHVYDPHSDYMDKQQLDNFAMSMNLSLEGIGAELTSPDGYCTIRKLVPGGPAEKSGKVKVNDRIVAVAQGSAPAVDVVDMNLNKAVQLIRGPKGTEVRLTIIPADAADPSVRKVVTLIRDTISLEEQAAKAKVLDLPGANGEKLRIGVIDLPSFYSSMDLTGTEDHSSSKSCSADVARLLKKLIAEKVQGVILDLRRNGGGVLEEAVRITGFFIKEGPVVQVRDVNDHVSVKADRDPRVLYDGPLVVLTSRFSASASEIVAAALQDYGRALIVGDSSTHGKGTVQAPSPLKAFMRPSAVVTNDPGLLKLTISKFYRVNGESTQLKGVVPDIVLPSVINYSTDFGESSLDYPLQWDTNAPAQFDRTGMIEPYKAELLKDSEARVTASKDYDYVREDIEQYKKHQADKTISLSESQRLKEKSESEARQKARDKELAARQEPDVKTYELTLHDVDQPGLPAPVAKTNAVAKAGETKAGATTAAASTNATLAAQTPRSADGEEDEADEPKPTPVDFALEESEHILVDYLRLLEKSKVLTSNRAGGQLPGDATGSRPAGDLRATGNN